MRILYINSMIHGSTGNIMRKLAAMSCEHGAEVSIACPEFDGKIEDKKNAIVISNNLDVALHHCLGRITGFNDCFSHIATFFFLEKVKKFNPDIIHIHNLHNCFLNVNMLFRFIKKEKKTIVWTLHDCWAFTGQCAYFDMSGCYQWETQCQRCMQIHRYPKTYIDNAKELYKRKRKWFTQIDNLHIVAPSFWLQELIKKSFLKEYPISVIHNGIDVEVFKRTERLMRKKYRLEHKYVVLGIAYRWDIRKGWDIFVELSKMLNPAIFQIVLVGVNSTQKKELSKDVICFDRIKDRAVLADIYSSADVFVNPTREENFCLVNLEALACGTPVIAFDTGGCAEGIGEGCGCIVEDKTVKGVIAAIDQMRGNPCKSETCRTWAEKYKEQERYEEYMNLYSELLDSKEGNIHDCFGIK